MSGGYSSSLIHGGTAVEVVRAVSCLRRDKPAGPLALSVVWYGVQTYGNGALSIRYERRCYLSVHVTGLYSIVCSSPSTTLAICRLKYPPFEYLLEDVRQPCVDITI